MAKKQSGVKTSIPQWCLDEVWVDAPSQEEVSEVATLLTTDHDLARIPDVLTFAAFSLMVRYPGTGGRHFGNDEIPLLSKRNPDVIKSVLAVLPDVAKDVMAALSPVKKVAPKTPTKKDK